LIINKCQNPLTIKVGKVFLPTCHLGFVLNYLKNENEYRQSVIAGQKNKYKSNKSPDKYDNLKSWDIDGSGEIYLVIEEIVEMIFKHMIGSDSLNFKAYLVFKIPSSVDGDQSFGKI